MTATAVLPRPATAPRAATGPATFALTLHVSDVPRAVAFYRVLFDREPAKHFHEYAEFVAADPAVVVGLLHVNRYPGMPVNHAGIRFHDPAVLAAARTRLELAGVRADELPAGAGVTVSDPDENRLDLCVGEPGHGALQAAELVPLSGPTSRVAWEHRICSPIPAAIPHADDGVDEVTLQATFNGGHPADEITTLVREAFRVLKPGGRIVVSGLVGDRPPAGPVNLPGQASRLVSLPVESEPMAALAAAGFIDLFYELFGDIICFQVPGIDMRKIRLTGTKPGRAVGGETVEVYYSGPLGEVETDDALAFRRGVPVRVPADLWRRIKTGPAGKQFVATGP